MSTALLSRRIWLAAVPTLTAAVLACAPLPPPGAVVVAGPPPPRRVEVVGVAPGMGYVWIAGHWTWQSNAYVWVDGRWQQPPRPRARWTPGHWVHSRRGYFWIEGHWR